jgi:hypothetical protein
MVQSMDDRAPAQAHKQTATAVEPELPPSRRVTVEDKVVGLGSLVAGKAGHVHRLVGGFAVVELSKPPTAG